MLLKRAANFSRLLFNRSILTTNTTSNHLKYSKNCSPLISTGVFWPSRTTHLTPNNNKNSINSSKQIHTTISRCYANEKVSNSKDQPLLSDELKNIMSKKFGEGTATEEGEKSKENLDVTSKSPPPVGESGAPSSSGEQSKPTKFGKYFTKEHGWKISFWFFTGVFGGLAVYVLVEWGAPKRDENNLPMIKDPSTDKLLPDPIQPPYYQPPYTLVIEITGILLHPEWTFNTGWRYKKRPGLDYFIEQIKYPMFEVVFFTREPFLAGAPIVSSLDPQNQIQFKLFRESTKFINNNYVKDISYMNRDINKIIVIDWDEKAYDLQPRNALHRLKKWDGDEKDTDLVYLASFLKMLANSGVNDVREVLDYYNKEIDPLETFKQKTAALLESEAERQKEIEALKEKQKKPAFSFFRR